MDCEMPARRILYRFNSHLCTCFVSSHHCFQAHGVGRVVQRSSTQQPLIFEQGRNVVTELREKNGFLHFLHIVPW